MSRSGSGARRDDRLSAILFLFPSTLVLATFGLVPIGFALYISLFKWGLARERFLGLENYVRALTSPEWWNALLVTLYYVLGVVPISLVLAIVLANVLFRVARGVGAYRTVYFLPYVTSTVAAAMVWSWIFHPQWGVVNAVLERLHLPTQRWLLEPRGIIELLVAPLGVEVPAWAAGPSLALVVLILFAIWYSIGFDTVVLLAALSNVPRELEDAARIDGASTVKLARYVTIPLLSPTLFFLAIISVIRSFQAFNHIYVLTGGGPLDTTCNATMYIFRSFYQYTKVGYGSAAAVLLFLIIVVLTVFQTRLLSRWVHY